jgi:hypothetical protein
MTYAFRFADAVSPVVVIRPLVVLGTGETRFSASRIVIDEGGSSVTVLPGDPDLVLPSE